MRILPASYGEITYRMETPFKLLLTAVFLFTAGMLAAQQHQLSVGLGFSRIDRQDQIFSPFVQSGYSAQQLDVQWQRQGRLVQFAGLSYSGFAASRFPAFDYIKKPELEVKTMLPNTFNFIQLEYGLGKQWQSGAYTFGVGGSLQNSVQALNYQYGEASFFGYFAAFSLSPWWNVSRTVGKKGRLQAEISVPVVSWVARSPYLVNDDEFIENISAHRGIRIFTNLIADGELQFPDRLQKVTASLGYSHAWNNRWTTGLRYRCQFVRHTDPLTLLSYQNDLRLEIGWKF